MTVTSTVFVPAGTFVTLICVPKELTVKFVPATVVVPNFTLEIFTKLLPEIVTAFPPACGPLFAATDSTLGSATGNWLEQAEVEEIPAVTVDGDIAAEPQVVGLGWNKAKVFAPKE